MHIVNNGRFIMSLFVNQYISSEIVVITVEIINLALAFALALL